MGTIESHTIHYKPASGGGIEFDSAGKDVDVKKYDNEFTTKEAQEQGLSPMAYYGDDLPGMSSKEAQEQGLSPMAWRGTGKDSAEEEEQTKEDTGWRGPPLMAWQGKDRPEEGILYERAEGVEEDVETVTGKKINIATPDITVPGIEFPKIEFPKISSGIKYALYGIFALLGIGVIGYFLQGLGLVTSSAATLKGDDSNE